MQYTFHTYKELATDDGFNYPIDVQYKTIYLGTLVALPHGFTIKQVDTPQGKQSIVHSKTNEFKSLVIAAEVLHRTWKQYRFGGYDNSNTGEPVPV